MIHLDLINLCNKCLSLSSV